MAREINAELLDVKIEWILIHLSMKIDIPLMLGYFEHIYKLPMKFFASRRTGDITTRFSDAFTIKDIFTNIALSLIMDISMAVITGVILFQMNPKLFAIILFMTVISILSVKNIGRALDVIIWIGGVVTGCIGIVGSVKEVLRRNARGLVVQSTNALLKKVGLSAIGFLASTIVSGLLLFLDLSMGEAIASIISF